MMTLGMLGVALRASGMEGGLDKFFVAVTYVFAFCCSLPGRFSW